jgi:transposase
VNTAKNSVGRHHSDTYRREIAYACEDIVALRGRLRELGRDIKQKLEQHDLGKLLTTINGVGAQTAAYLIAELGDPARFHGAAAWASYVGVASRQTEILWNCRDPSRERAAAKGALDASPHSRTIQSVVASLL